MLLTGQRLEKTAEADRTELLRQILTKQQRRNVGYREAREVGDTLLEFYQVLAEEVDNESEQ